MKVLIATDGSRFSNRAIDWVAKMTWSADYQFLVLSVVECPYLDYGMVQAPDNFMDKITSELQTVLDTDSAALKKLLPQNIITSKLIYGRVQHQIAQEARDWSADLLIKGSHGRKGLNHLLLGSVAEAVLHQVSCSVLIVKDHQRAGQSQGDRKIAEETAMV